MVFGMAKAVRQISLCVLLGLGALQSTYAHTKSAVCLMAFALSVNSPNVKRAFEERAFRKHLSVPAFKELDVATGSGPTPRKYGEIEGLRFTLSLEPANSNAPDNWTLDLSESQLREIVTNRSQASWFRALAYFQLATFSSGLHSATLIYKGLELDPHHPEQWEKMGDLLYKDFLESRSSRSIQNAIASYENAAYYEFQKNPRSSQIARLNNKIILAEQRDGNQLFLGEFLAGLPALEKVLQTPPDLNEGNLQTLESGEAPARKSPRKKVLEDYDGLTTRKSVEQLLQDTGNRISELAISLQEIRLMSSDQLSNVLSQVKSSADSRFSTRDVDLLTMAKLRQILSRVEVLSGRASEREMLELLGQLAELTGQFNTKETGVAAFRALDKTLSTAFSRLETEEMFDLIRRIDERPENRKWGELIILSRFTSTLKSGQDSPFELVDLERMELQFRAMAQLKFNEYLDTEPAELSGTAVRLVKENLFSQN